MPTDGEMEGEIGFRKKGNLKSVSTNDITGFKQGDPSTMRGSCVPYKAAPGTNRTQPYKYNSLSQFLVQ